VRGLMKTAAEVPLGFSQPTALPAGAEQQEGWQAANRTWWETHPMRYDWKHAIAGQEFSREFFAVSGHIFEKDALHKSVQRRTDGAIARY